MEKNSIKDVLEKVESLGEYGIRKFGATTERNFGQYTIRLILRLELGPDGITLDVPLGRISGHPNELLAILEVIKRGVSACTCTY